MQYSRRFWATLGVCVFLAVLAAVARTPVLLAGSVAIGAWLTAHAYAFVVGAQRTVDGLGVEVTVTPATVRTDTETVVTVMARRQRDIARPQPVEIACSLPGPAGVVDGVPTLDLSAATDATSSTVVLTVPIAGRFEVGPCQLAVSDAAGLFRSTVTAKPSATLFVQPRAPRKIHVGQGGNQLASAYGEHDLERGSGGLEPAELREYVPGDPQRNIDWNATARLGDAYVREFEAESDRETLLVVDHRAPMGVGATGETKLDYGRELALAVVESANALSDPLGLLTVGDDGHTAHYEPSATETQYQRIRTQLTDLAPTDNPDLVADPRDPGEVRDLRGHLSGDDSAFAAALSPLYAGTEDYVEGVDTDPFLHAVRTTLIRRGTPDLAVLVTDDTARTELRETVRLLRGQGVRTVCYLLADALYDAGGLADLDAAYASYVEFESFRRDLTRMPRVTAYEVAPADRLAAVLSSTRDSRVPEA